MCQVQSADYQFSNISVPPPAPEYSSQAYDSSYPHNYIASHDGQYGEDPGRYTENVGQYHEATTQFGEDARHYHENEGQYCEDAEKYDEDPRQYRDVNDVPERVNNGTASYSEMSGQGVETSQHDIHDQIVYNEDSEHYSNGGTGGEYDTEHDVARHRPVPASLDLIIEGTKPPEASKLPRLRPVSKSPNSDAKGKCGTGKSPYSLSTGKKSNNLSKSPNRTGKSVNNRSKSPNHSVSSSSGVDSCPSSNDQAANDGAVCYSDNSSADGSKQLESSVEGDSVLDGSPSKQSSRISKARLSKSPAKRPPSSIPQHTRRSPADRLKSPDSKESPSKTAARKANVGGAGKRTP